jgi:hypothetical protein
MALLRFWSRPETAQHLLALPLEAGLRVPEDPSLFSGLEVSAVRNLAGTFLGANQGEGFASGGNDSSAPVVAAIKSALSLKREA